MHEEYSESFRSIYEAIPQGKAFRIYFDSKINQMKIMSREYDKFEEIRQAFSCENQQAFFSKQYGYNVESRKYAINKFGYFHPGLVFEILEWIKTHYGDLSFIAISKKCLSYVNDILQPLKKQLNGKTFDLVNISDETGRNDRFENKMTYRDYQLNSVKALLFKGFGRGLIEIPTSGGKSFIISNFIWNLHRSVNKDYKVMIFVPNTQLVEQFYKDLIDYGYNKEYLAKFTGSLKAKERKQQDLVNSKIIIANRQYVFSNKEKLPKIDVLICDEVHQTVNGASQEYVQNSEASIKIGCTGTLPKDKLNYWTLLGMFGKVVYREEVTDLQNRGFISNLKITLLDILHKGVQNNRHYLFHVDSLHKYHPDEFGNSEVLFNDAYTAELDFYEKQSAELYRPVLEYLNKLDENVIVLFDRIETGKNLFELSKEIVTSKKSHYIDGSTPIEDRENIRQQLEKTGDNILIGNVSVIGTGINIKRLSHISFLCNTKSHTRTIQSIGRVLRLHQSKQNAHLIDIRFNFKYSQKHYNERLQFYKDTYHKNKPDEIINIEI